MSDNLRDFLKDLADAGETQGTGSGFTLRSDKAREKLKKFALAHPENYFLLVIAALHSLGARNFRMRVDADDLEIQGDCGWERAGLSSLWEKVAGDTAGSENSALRLLGLAILTSVRFSKVDWSVDSRDSAGGYRFLQSIRSEELLDSQIESKQEAGEVATVVRVKRKDFKTVTSRFFTQISRRLRAGDLDEKNLIRQRVFLGALKSFEFNRCLLDCRLAESQALVVYRVGEGLELLEGKYEFSDPGELAMLVILGGGPNLPGEPKKISWLWHGLRMGEGRLGLSYSFCRAYVVADGLQCDLGLTSVVDSWATQKVIRQAREAARKALELTAEHYLKIQQGAWECGDQEMEGYLLEVAAQRIDIRRSRHRMGTFNDTLIRCPFFRIIEPDGTKRRATLFEIWEWIEKGENPALFRTREEWVEVEDWDRPVVILAEKTHSDTLLKIFGDKAFHSGKALARRLSQFKQGPYVPPSDGDFQGRFEIDGQFLNWSLELDGGPGKVVGLKGGSVYFKDFIPNLPNGLTVYGEVQWKPDFLGHLEKTLQKRVVRGALDGIAHALSAVKPLPSPVDLRATTLLFRSLGPDQAAWKELEADRLDWLWVGNHQTPRMSPENYRRLVEQGELAFYYRTFRSAVERGEKASWPVHLLVDEGALRFLPPEFQDVRGLERLEAKQPFDPSSLKGWHLISMNGPDFERMVAGVGEVVVAFPPRTARASGVVLEINLRGHKLQSRPISTFVGPAVICLELSQGWPDSQGRHLVHKEQMENLKALVPKILTRAGRSLWKEASVQLLEGLHEEVQSTVLVDIWSEGEGDREKRILTASGDRVSIDELRSRSKILYFSDWSRTPEVPAEAIYLTGVQMEALALATQPEVWVDVLEDFRRDASGTLDSPPRVARKPEPEPKLELEPQRPVPMPVAEAPPGLERKPRSPATLKPLRKTKPDRPPSPQSESPEPVESAPSTPQVVDHPEMGSTVRVLRGIFSELQSSQTLPFGTEFETFLSTLGEKAGPGPLLQESDGRLSLRALKSPSPEQLLAILSALYSQFNHSREHVEDSHERVFHLALVQYAGRESSSPV